MNKEKKALFVLLEYVRKQGDNNYHIAHIQSSTEALKGEAAIRANVLYTLSDKIEVLILTGTIE